MNGLLSHHILRVVEPGLPYNLGNVLGFIAGFAVLVAAHNPNLADASPWESASQYLVGSPVAVALTTATAIFAVGGVAYCWAWANGAPPDGRFSRVGDLLSALGATCLAYGPFTLGDPILATSAGILHAACKFGSASGSEVALRWLGCSVTLGNLCKNLVLFSWAPAILSAMVGFTGDWISISVVFCCLLWGSADWTPNTKCARQFW